MPAKDYSYFGEVIDLIRPVLERENIKILHLGQDSSPLNNVINLNNQTNLGQAAFLLKRSLLHLGVDSWMAHYCGAENIPLISLYGNTTVANHSPYLYNKDKTIFLESHRNGNKATFAREENPKTIDFINPEDVAKSVMKLLNLPFNYEYKTLWIGPAFTIRTIESVNDCVVDTNKLGVVNIIVRNDYNFNLNNLFGQLQVCKCCIITNKPIPIQPLQQLRQNVIEVIYEITKEHDIKFVKALSEAKIPFKLYTKLSEEELNPIKLDYLDYPLIYQKNLNPPEVLKDIKDYSNIYYRSSRFLVSSNGIYSSYWDYKNSRSLQGFNNIPLQLMDINLKEELWCDREYLYLMEKIV